MKGDRDEQQIGSKVDPRILFANERTLLAWIRTGLALTGFGFVVARYGLYLRELEAMDRVVQSPPFSLWLGVLMVVVSIAVYLAGIFQHRAAIRRLRRGEHEFEATVSPAAILAITLAVIGLLVVIYLFAVQGSPGA